MARLIQKTGFISRKSAGGYMKYIATREGVEVLTGKGPATEKQKEMVAKLLKDFPDVRDSFEYEDYKQAPTLHTASALISAALDSHMQNLQSENGYLKYIATRPGAEKHGAHGLFGRQENTNLTAAMHDLTAHDGNVWTIIYSLHREDAERLGYNNAAAWRKLLVSQQNKFAEAFHIPASALHWYAAYRNERYVGQIVTGIVTDERWYQETAYLEQYPDLHRPQNKPYYYVDFSERKARLIFLSSYVSQIDEQEELFEKSCQYGAEQLAWLKTEALQLPEGWAIFLFSHALPKSRFETGTDPWNYMEYASEPAMMLLRQAQKHGIRIGGWFAGHYACDYETTFCHIPYFLIDSVRPQPIKSLFPNVRKCTERGLGAETEDLWDVLLLKPNQRRIYLLRFGAGEDRVFDY